MASIANCRDEMTTQKDLRSFLYWLESHG